MPMQVQDAIQLILDSRPKGASGGGGGSPEEEVDRICEDLLEKIPPLFDGTLTVENRALPVFVFL